MNSATSDTNNLFVGTAKFYYYLTSGLEVWWTNNAGAWVSVEDGGFGNSNNDFASSMVVFNDFLYVGTGNPNGLEIWRTSCPLLLDGFESGNCKAWTTTVGQIP